MTKDAERLLDRYLDNIRFWLPAKTPGGATAEDILAELREDLLSQIADRNLNADELAAILRKRGEPTFVAGQFAKHTPLIGADWMPAYWQVLQLINLRILMPVFLFIIGPIEWLQQEPSAGLMLFGLGQLWNLIAGQFISAGIITLIFAILERSAVRIGWDPLKMPAMPRPPALRRPKVSVIADFGGAVIGTFLWITLLRAPEITSVTIGKVHVSLAPVVFDFMWPMLFLAMASVMLNWFSLAWPARLAHGPWLRVGLDAANLAVLCALLSHGGPWILANSGSIEQLVNQTLTIGFAVAILVSLWELTMKVRCNLRHARTA